MKGECEITGEKDVCCICCLWCKWFLTWEACGRSGSRHSSVRAVGLCPPHPQPLQARPPPLPLPPSPVTVTGHGGPCPWRFLPFLSKWHLPGSLPSSVFVIIPREVLKSQTTTWWFSPFFFQRNIFLPYDVCCLLAFFSSGKLQAINISGAGSAMLWQQAGCLPTCPPRWYGLQRDSASGAPLVNPLQMPNGDYCAV